MTNTVQTVLGPIPVDELGFTLMHEHLMCSFSGFEADSTLKFDREGEINKAVARLRQLKGLGISSMVDPTPMEMARDPSFMAEVSRQAGINLICSTGLYIEHIRNFGDVDLLWLFGFPPYFRLLSQGRLEQIYATELTEGIGPERIRPGVIKCATGPDKIGKYEERALRAAARTAVELDVRLTTHTTYGTMGNEQLDIFLSEGMKPHHIVIGHCDWNTDPAYHRSLLERGCYIGFDLIGSELAVTDGTRVKEIVEFARVGDHKQIMLSQDHCGCFQMRDEDLPPFTKAQTTETTPKRRYTYLVQEFIPALLKAGVSEAAIRTMTVENPRRYFAGEAL